MGIFELGYYEFDSLLVLINMEDVECLFCLDGLIGVCLKLVDMD